MGGRDGYEKNDYIYGTLYSSLGMAIHYLEKGPQGISEVSKYRDPTSPPSGL
jgi:hypothetical protein